MTPTPSPTPVNPTSLAPRNLTPDKNPVAIGALVLIMVNVVLTGLTVFKVADLTAEQTSWVYAAVNAVTSIVVAIKTRQLTWAPYTVREADREAGIDPHLEV